MTPEEAGSKPLSLSFPCVFRVVNISIPFSRKHHYLFSFFLPATPENRYGPQGQSAPKRRVPAQNALESPSIKRRKKLSLAG
jgi:hypothetical protein